MTRPESMTNPWRVVVLTGAQGFVGQSLARTLIAWMRELDSTEGSIDQLRDAQLDEPRHPSVPRHLLLTDIGPRPSWCPDDDPRIQWISGDLSDPSVVRALIDHDVTGVFHLAGIVSGAAEADFDKGLRVNFDATRELAMAIAEPHRGQASGRKTESPVSPALPLARSPVRFIHASSIAVYGVPLPLHIDDHTQPWPSLSYGAQKLACELLLADMSRRGMLDSLSLRLSGVVVRPALPNGALSAFNSDLIRETLAGRPIVSPVSALATLWLQSIEITVRNLIHAMGPRWLPACRTSLRPCPCRRGVMCRSWWNLGPTRPSSPCLDAGPAAERMPERRHWGLATMRRWQTSSLLRLDDYRQPRWLTQTTAWAATWRAPERQ
jgi:nucleoside-diphosphate-sugar epimerase